MSDGYKCVLLFGAPGVGKGTQGKLLGEEDGLLHLATGDIFRSLDRDSDLGRKFVEYSSRGELVPDDLTIALWRDHVKGLIASGAYDPARDLLLLDGMPRSLSQATQLDGIIDPLLIIHLTAKNIDDMVARMRLRAETQGRHDDTDVAVIRKRFSVYEAETSPVLHHYDPSLIRDIDAVGTVDEVTARVRAVLVEVRPSLAKAG